MPKLYTQEQKDNIFNAIFVDLVNGMAIRNSIKSKEIDITTFYNWINNNEDYSKRYARATELRSIQMADEILNIADSTADDVIIDEEGNAITNHNIIQRDRLRVDTRKWLMSKICLLYTSPSPRDKRQSRMPSSA